MYLQGIPPTKYEKKFDIKGLATILKGIELGIYGIKYASRRKTNYQYSFKIKIVYCYLEYKVSTPITAKKFHIRSSAIIWKWKRGLEAGSLKPSKKIMTKKYDTGRIEWNTAYQGSFF